MLTKYPKRALCVFKNRTVKVYNFNAKESNFRFKIVNGNNGDPAAISFQHKLRNGEKCFLRIQGNRDVRCSRLKKFPEYKT